jgi:hypothetical protein
MNSGIVGVTTRALLFVIGNKVAMKLMRGHLIQSSLGKGGTGRERSTKQIPPVSGGGLSIPAQEQLAFVPEIGSEVRCRGLRRCWSSNSSQQVVRLRASSFQMIRK